MSFDTTQVELESLFSQVGNVTEVFIPTDRTTGRPRGFAFVEFDSPEAVTEAIDRFDGFELAGRNLRVNEAHERQRRPSGFSDGPPSGGGGGGGSFRPPGGGRPSKPKGSRRNVRSRKRGF